VVGVRVKVAGSSGIRDAEQLASAESVLTALKTARPTVLHLPDEVMISGTLIDFIPQELRIVPVSYGSVPVGVLVVAFAQTSTPEAEAVLNASLPGLAVALNNSLNHEDLQRVSALDPLTGVYNRRFGLQRLTGQRIPVTVSIGGSGLPDKNTTNAKDLILVADAAMYSSKESGRDRSVFT